MARARAVIDLKTLEGLARIFATIEEAALVLGVSERTLKRYLDPKYRGDASYREAWARGAAMGKVSLRRLAWQKAQEKGAAGGQMIIHLAKHHLGESEAQLERKPPEGEAVHLPKGGQGERPALKQRGPGGEVRPYMGANVSTSLLDQINKRGKQPEPKG